MSERLAVCTNQLAKRYRELVALGGLSIQVPTGSVFGFLGPNGAGKTTAIKLLLGLVRASAGEGTVLGRPLGSLEAKKRIGYLPELFRYQDWLSAREVLALHAGLMGLERSRWPSEIERVLELAGLSSRSDDRIATFSKGMQQRLGLAVALLGEPELIFLDEPTSALDPVGRHDVRQIVHALQEQGTTVFLNSHLLSEVELICDQVAIVKSGKVLAAGAMDDLLSQDVLRIRVTGLSDPSGSLASFGSWSVEQDGWHGVHGVTEAAIPELVQAIVRLGGRIYAIEPRRQSLEERFLGLLGET